MDAVNFAMVFWAAWNIMNYIFEDKVKLYQTKSNYLQARIKTTATFARTLKNFVSEKSGKRCRKSGKH